MARIGFEMVVMASIKTCDSCSGTIASFIISIPINKIPRPAKISPIEFNFLFFKKVTKTTPQNAITGAILLASNAIS